MTKEELKIWSMYLAKEPVNSVEIQLAYLTSVVASLAGSKSKHTIDDFIITSYKKDKETIKAPISNAQILASLGGIG